MKQFGLRIILGCAVLTVLGGFSVFAQDSPKPIAELNGEPIYEQDLMSVVGPKLLDLRSQEYKLKTDALSTVIHKKLIDLEAKSKGLTTEQLLTQEVDSKVLEPSDDEARGYYLAVKSGTTLPFDQIKPQVKRLLKNAEIQRARDEYADSLRAKAEVSVFLRPPLSEMSYDPARVRGSSDAAVTILEFADFQCPYCKKTESTLKELLKKYDGQVKLAYRDFPLTTIHEHAEMAAEASHCALAQGKYWEMHDAMFADQAKLDQPTLVNTAAALGMDQAQFESCLNSEKYKAIVQQDINAGSEAGVEATPVFFINGELLQGARSEAEFAEIIDRQLASIRSGGVRAAR